MDGQCWCLGHFDSLSLSLRDRCLFLARPIASELESGSLVVLYAVTQLLLCGSVIEQCSSVYIQDSYISVGVYSSCR